MIETITAEEFIAEMLPQWLIEELDEMIIYIDDGTEECDEGAEDEYSKEEE